MTEYLTVKEVAAELRVCTKTVENWIKAGRLRAVKAGGCWRIEREAVAAMLKGKG